MRGMCVKIPIIVFANPPHPVEACFLSLLLMLMVESIDLQGPWRAMGLAHLEAFQDAGAPILLDEATYHLRDLRACH